MMRRIDWSTAPAVGAAPHAEDEEEEEELPPNVCTLVRWHLRNLRNVQAWLRTCGPHPSDRATCLWP
jgi:hypothetical protein